MPYVPPTSGAPTNADYWIETANSSLSAEVVVGSTGITTTTYAARQAAAKAGRLFLPSDSSQIERDTGAAWSPWGPLFALTAPDDSGFSWVNQTHNSTTATTDTTQGGVYLEAPYPAATPSYRLRVKSAPSTPYVITAAFIGALYPSGGAQFGLFFRESGTGELAGIAVVFGTSNFEIQKWTSPTAFSSNYTTLGFRGTYNTITWLRIADNGTNRLTSISVDGQHWRQVHSIGRTDWLTADQVGWGVNTDNSGQTCGATLISWNVT